MALNKDKGNRETYYTLRPERGGGIGSNTRQLMAGADDIRIGQTPDCEWHFDNASNYVDEVFAVIRPGQLSGEWILVPASEHVGTSVNGSRVNLIHYLNDGDVISFDGERQELRFNVHNDGRYSTDIGVAYIPMKLSTGTKLRLAIIAAIAIACVYWFGIQIPIAREVRVNNKILHLSESVYQITVDSVYYVATITDEDGIRHDSILDRYSYNFESGGAVSGTAFVVNDSLLFTARHCIEPWLNDTTINRATCPDELQEGPVRWAFEAETVNQLCGKDSLRLISQCIISYSDAGSIRRDTCTSDDFLVDRSRDDIVPKGKFRKPCYWRSIWKRGAKRSQMLGDVAYTITQEPHDSDLRLADDDYLTTNLRDGKTLYFLGYPNYDEKKFDHQRGMLKKDYKGNELLWHDANLIHGYSGGPVVVLDEDMATGALTATVVGIISLADSKGFSRSYSVPVTERKNNQE